MSNSEIIYTSHDHPHTYRTTHIPQFNETNFRGVLNNFIKKNNEETNRTNYAQHETDTTIDVNFSVQ